MQDPFPIPPGVPTKAVVLNRGAIRELPRVMDELGIPRAPCILFADNRTIAAAGEAVEAALRPAGFHASRYVLPDDAHQSVSGSEAQLMEMIEASAGASAILGVGSGVINDLCKLAAQRANKRYIAVATAASMNGYGSPIAAFIEAGVKRTLPAAPTEAIIADLDVIAAAPIDLTRSGFADLLSKASATADWMLAHLVRGEPYDSRPHELLDPVVKVCQACAADIGRAEPDALALLMQGLIYGAFAMVLAGHSAPASGGEHLISHLWDMQTHAAHASEPGGPPPRSERSSESPYAPTTKHALHGYQVALGTRVAAALYEKLLRLEPRDIDVDAAVKRWQPWEQACQTLRATHGPLADAIEPEAQKQFLTRAALAAEVRHVRDRWDDIRAALRPLLLTADHLRDLHATAGVPLTPSAVGQTRATLRHALLHAKDVRARFTVLDLASELGMLEPWSDEVLDAAGIG